MLFYRTIKMKQIISSIAKEILKEIRKISLISFALILSRFYNVMKFQEIEIALITFRQIIVLEGYQFSSMMKITIYFTWNNEEYLWIY